MNQQDIAQLFAYTEWANALVLDAAEKLADEQLRADRQISHGSILGTLLHMAAAEWIWLERWHGRSHTGAGAWAQWQLENWPTVAALRTRWQTLAAERRALLAALSEAELQAERSFKRVDGSESSLPLIQQMQHVVNHASLHRGQVVGMIRQLGIAPPATDLLFYLRAPQK
jgi:uncharacterized damage-inducible protein DinB